MLPLLFSSRWNPSSSFTSISTPPLADTPRSLRNPRSPGIRRAHAGGSSAPPLPRRSPGPLSSTHCVRLCRFLLPVPAGTHTERGSANMSPGSRVRTAAGHTQSAAPGTGIPILSPPGTLQEEKEQMLLLLFSLHWKSSDSLLQYLYFSAAVRRAERRGANAPFPVSSPRKPIGSPASISMSPPADTRRAPRRLVLPASAGHMPGAVPQTRPPASAGAAAEQHVACGSRRGSVLLQLRIYAPPDAPQTKFRPSLRPVEKSSPDA